MSFLDALTGRLPGLVAAGFAGRNVAERERYRREQAAMEQARQQQQFEADMRRKVLEEGILRFDLERKPTLAARDDERFRWEGDTQRYTASRRPVLDQLDDLKLDNERISNETARLNLNNYESPQQKRERDAAVQRGLISARLQGSGPAGGGRPMPVALQERINKLDSAVENIDLALGLMTGDGPGFSEAAKTAFGSAQTWRNATPNLPIVGGVAAPFVNRYMDRNLSPEAVTMRAQIGSAGSMLLNLLSGAAISPAEYVRLKGFVPDVNENDPATTYTKLQNLRRELAGSAERYRKGASASVDLSPEDFEAQLKAAGVSDADVRSAMEAYSQSTQRRAPVAPTSSDPRSWEW